MKLEEVIIYKLKMPLKTPFVTSASTVTHKTVLAVRAKDESGIVGWGEGVAFDDPSYTEETATTTLHMLQDFLVPMLLGQVLTHPDDVSRRFASIRRNNMAKSAIEGAIWDIYAQLTKQSLAAAVGGVRKQIEVGVAIGLQQSKEDLFAAIRQRLAQGYKRIKVKIKPGQDIELLRTIRQKFPAVPLMADANSAYTLADAPLLKQLDEFDLLMIEQPLAHDDLIEHAMLQQQIRTPICLDESITSLADMERAIHLGSCKVVNLKIARVGGISEAIRIHDLCAKHEIDVWCGGMLEAGIGRAHCVALTTLSNFTLPGDTAASSNYWYEDLIEPEVTVQDGFIYVPNQVGIGYTVKEQWIREHAIASYSFSTK